MYRLLFFILFAVVWMPNVQAQIFTAEPLATLRGYSGHVREAQFSPDGRLLAVTIGNHANTLEVLDQQQKVLYSHTGGVPNRAGCVGFSGDGRYLFFTNYRSHDDIAVLDLQSMQIVQTIRRHQDFINKMVVSRDGQYVVTASYDRTVRIWEWRGTELVEIQSFQSNAGIINDLAINAQGAVIAAANTNQTVTIWQRQGRQFQPSQVLSFAQNVVKALALNANGELLAIGGTNRRLELFVQQDNGQYASRMQVLAHQSAVYALDFSPDGTYIASGSADRAVKVFRVTSRTLLTEKEMIVHDGFVRDLCFSNDGRRLVSASDDRTAFVWQTGGITGTVAATTDWSPTGSSPARPQPAGLPPILSIESLTFSEARLEANETAELKVVVRNSGPGDATQARLEIKSSKPGIVFPQFMEFPLIEKNGGVQVLSVKVRGTEALTEGSTELDVDVVEEAFGIRLQGKKFMVQTSGLPMPKLILAKFAVVENASAQPNNQIDLNEMIDVKFVVQNVGVGDAKNISPVVANTQKGVLFLGVVDGSSLKRQDPVVPLLASGKFETFTYRYFVNSEFNEQQLHFDIKIKEAAGTAALAEVKHVDINKQLKEEGQIVVMPGKDRPSDQPVPVTQLPDWEIDIRKDLPKARRVNPDAIAVVIGNRDYRNQDVPTVDFAIEDARLVKEYLIKSFGFREGNILYYQNATQADFNTLFGTDANFKGKLFNFVKPNASDVFIFYSGHGAPDPETKTGYFVPVDCYPSLVALNGYSLNTFYQNLAQVPFKSLTVVIDACFSGSSEKGMLLKNISPVFIKAQNRVLRDEKAAVFTSASADQVSSWYPDKRHSLFTYYFLKGLKGEANTNQDKTLTVSELRQYLQDNVPYMARRLNNREQTPEIIGTEERVLIDY